jgi:hypothetical protein
MLQMCFEVLLGLFSAQDAPIALKKSCKHEATNWIKSENKKRKQCCAAINVESG